MKDGKYQEPENLPYQVNSGLTKYNAFIDPDEKYLIVPVDVRKDTFGSTDYYLAYSNPHDKWSEHVNIGDKINTASGHKLSPNASHDANYFFLMSRLFKEGKWPQELAFHF